MKENPKEIYFKKIYKNYLMTKMLYIFKDLVTKILLHVLGLFKINYRIY